MNGFAALGCNTSVTLPVRFPPDVERKDNPVCRFETPLEGNMDPVDLRPTEVRPVSWHPRSLSLSHMHLSDQTSLYGFQATEVKYVKRRKEIVIREYHKWRAYFKKRVCTAVSVSPGSARSGDEDSDTGFAAIL